jgi:fibronectin type 3 domain-containing protein
MPVSIRFTPSVSGQATGNFIVVSNAANSPTSEALRGTGVAAGSHEADLSWDASSGAVGYYVYRGNSHGGPYSRMNSVLEASTNYADTSVTGGATYFYVATAVNSSGDESGYSNEAKIQIPK